MRQHKDSSIGDALKKKQWLFGVGGFLLLGLIVGCDKDEQPKQEVQAEPAAAAPADSAAEFSENTKLLLALYQELHLFKDDPEFHEVGFGACCRFHDWQTRVEELRSRTELETLMDIDVVPGDLLVLGLEYMKSKGSLGYPHTRYSHESGQSRSREDHWSPEECRWMDGAHVGLPGAGRPAASTMVSSGGNRNPAAGVALIQTH